MLKQANLHNIKAGGLVDLNGDHKFQGVVIFRMCAERDLQPKPSHTIGWHQSVRSDMLLKSIAPAMCLDQWYV